MTFATQTVTSVVASSAAPTGASAEVADGRRLFVTGLGRWSLKGQAWNSCEACHPDGLTDHVTWFFGRGPRQTPSLDATVDAMGVPRLLNWTAVFDEVSDFELNARNSSGGVGAVVHRAGDGAMPPRLSNEDRIVFDGTTPPTQPQPRTVTPQEGLSGSMDSIATPDMTTGSQGATGFNPPSLLGVAHGAPYFHAGNARTLEEALGRGFAAHRDGYAPTGMFEGPGGLGRLRQLVAFVLSIDERTEVVATPARIGGSSGFDPDVCGQFR